jgi:hypothetical protein
MVLRILPLVALFCVAFSVTREPQSLADQSDAVDFGRDIRPILADKCYACHGPDAAQRKAGLRLDKAEAVLGERDGEQPIVKPGAPTESELWQRVASQDADIRMPPEDSGVQLTDAEIELLGRWIKEGGRWSQHWSFDSPRRSSIPSVEKASWVRNAIDAFILSRLEAAGIAPAPRADRVTLIRRLTLDLTGLPPTPAEVDAFLADDSPHAYDRLVDRLFQSPRYGERMAIEWMDAARYADTSGYQTDGTRSMWRWRDWVINAFNRDLPYDRFTIEQIAGDLLANPTLEQLIATGFHRNHRSNSEGGIVDEEFLLEYAVDRVETTGTVWLGLTVGCARCHDHKYDPLKQREFYELLAFFNNVPERGRVFKHHNSEPLIKAPTQDMRIRLDQLEQSLRSAQLRCDSLSGDRQNAQASWEKSQSELKELPFDESLTFRLAFDGDLLVEGANTGPAEVVGQTVAFVDGRQRQAVQLDGLTHVDAGPMTMVDATNSVTVAAWVRPAEEQTGPILSVIDLEATRRQGFSVHLHEGRLRFNIGPRWIDDGLRVQTKELLEQNRWHHVAVTYDGSERVRGIQLYVDGQRQELEVLLDKLTGGFLFDQPLRIGYGTDESRFVGDLDEICLYDRVLTADEIQIVACTDSIQTIVATDSVKRTAAQQTKLEWYYLRYAAPLEIRTAFDDLAAAQRELDTFDETVPTSMVMREKSPVPEAFVLNRGQYDQPGTRVEPRVPSWLTPLPDKAPRNRLGLAQWLVTADHPLTSRVAVNRYWQMFFGQGLVATAEDFGTQGTRPSYTALLDWLATEFVRLDWDVKAIHRLIVSSATYQQSSEVRVELLDRDPENQLLARAPRMRLMAEMVRDQALAAAGLLGSTIGGASVKPYQPEGLWEELGAPKYTPDVGAQLYRRSMYTFWKRTVPPAVMATFDGPTREFCQVRRSRTNTPLQALALLNDVTYVEAAREVARRMLRETGTSDAERLQVGFRLLVARYPTATEIDLLDASLQRARRVFEDDASAAEQFLAVGASELDTNLEPLDWAAFTVAASIILNLDETITRE